jgi:hypothetical protein
MKSSPAPKKRGRATGSWLQPRRHLIYTTTVEDSDTPAPVVPEKKGMCLPRYTNSLLNDDNTDIKLKALYDPHLLKDYGGPIFVHKRAKLVQQRYGQSDPSLRGIREFAHGDGRLDESVFQCTAFLQAIKFARSVKLIC